MLHVVIEFVKEIPLLSVQRTKSFVGVWSVPNTSIPQRQECRGRSPLPGCGVPRLISHFRRRRQVTKKLQKEREIPQLSILFRKEKVENRTMAIQIIENSQVLVNKNIHSKEQQTWHFHKRLPGYAPTPLIEAPQLARQLGVGNIWIKDETRRFDMPSFKILGTSWAVYQALMSRLGKEIESWETFDDLARIFAPLRPLTLVAATDGNHGRAVAHMAALLGFDSHIFVPRGNGGESYQRHQEGRG